MHLLLADADPSGVLDARVRIREVANRPVIAVLYALSGGLMELFGPIFWATLIVLFIEAELFAP